jgi:glycosyl hydrolase family 47
MPDRIAPTAFLLAAFAAFAMDGCVKSRPGEDAQQLAARVRTEFLHAWNNYERYAWGHDALQPLNKTGHDWYGQSLLMTPVDSLDTLILMHLDAEAERARALIISDLSFDRDIYVKNFEMTIRLLGGLLSSYQLTGDKRLLNLAEDLGNRLLPVFNSPTGLPYVYVNLRTGQTRDPVTNPAETGTLLLEFGTLSKLTGRPVFYEKAKRALVETFKRRSPLGLVGDSIDVETGAWTNTDSHISGGIDSYYEYLWKCWLLFGDKDCRDMWNASIPAINKYLADEIRGELWYGPAIWSARVDCKRHRSRCGPCTASSRKLSITKRCRWSREVIICVPKSLSLLITFTITRVTQNIGAGARKCSMISLNIAAPRLVTLRSPT